MALKNIDPNIVRKLASSLPNAYDDFLFTAKLRDNPQLRKIWTSAYQQGYSFSRQWFPASEEPSRDGWFLVQIGSSETDPTKARVAYFRQHNPDPWVWLIAGGGLIVLKDVLAWQPIPPADAESLPAAKDLTHFLGLKNPLTSMGRFFEGTSVIRGSFDDGDDWRVVRDAPNWRFEFCSSSHQASTLLSGLRWLLAQRRKSKRSKRTETHLQKDVEEEID